MVSGIAHQMQQRFTDFFSQHFVQLSFNACGLQADLFAGLCGKIMQHALKTAEQVSHRHHAEDHGPLLHLFDQQRDRGCGFGGGRIAGLFDTGFKFGGGGDQFHHQINQLVQFVCFYFDDFALSDGFGCRLMEGGSDFLFSLRQELCCRGRLGDPVCNLRYKLIMVRRDCCLPSLKALTRLRI